jgi:hypothetical protein
MLNRSLNPLPAAVVSLGPISRRLPARLHGARYRAVMLTRYLAPRALCQVCETGLAQLAAGEGRAWRPLEPTESPCVMGTETENHGNCRWRTSLSRREAGKLHITPADIQDRDGAAELLRQTRRLFPFVERIIGDAGYQGPKMAASVARTGRWTLEIVRRCDRHCFWSCPNDGSSNGAWRGSATTVAWRVTTNATPAPPLRLSASRAFG